MAQTSDKPFIVRGDGNCMHVDPSFFPVLITTWYGPATEPVVRAYYAWLMTMGAKARAKGSPLVSINDAGLAGVPSPSVRRVLGELAKEGDPALRALPMHSITVIENVLVRGALTAIAWFHSDMRTLAVGSRVEALQKAIDLLKPLDIHMPGLLAEASRRPLRPA